MDKLSRLVLDVEEIKKRNVRVEADKSWETSVTRRFVLTLFTFLSVGAYLDAVGVANPWVNAIVPSVAFMLSTLTLPAIKSYWSKHIRGCLG